MDGARRWGSAGGGGNARRPAVRWPLSMVPSLRAAPGNLRKRGFGSVVVGHHAGGLASTGRWGHPTKSTLTVTSRQVVPHRHAPWVPTAHLGCLGSSRVGPEARRHPLTLADLPCPNRPNDKLQAERTGRGPELRSARRQVRRPPHSTRPRERRHEGGPAAARARRRGPPACTRRPPHARSSTPKTTQGYGCRRPLGNLKTSRSTATTWCLSPYKTCLARWAAVAAPRPRRRTGCRGSGASSQ